MSNRKPIVLLTAFSILVVAAIAALMLMPALFRITAFNPFVLPKINASLNTGTSIVLLMALIAIKKGNIKVHKMLMLFALVLSTLFIISYLLYHAQGIEVKFGDLDGNALLSADEKAQAGSVRYLYYFILLTHILISSFILPFILISYYFGLVDNRQMHKKLARITWPLWFYVSVSGVMVYIMLSPYYKFYQ